MFEIVKNIIHNHMPSSERSKLAGKNIYQSFLLKVVNILISLAIIPITINYISVEQYGIWITISSIVAWLAYFDIGLGNGFRFKFAEAKASGNTKLAKQYVSTTYAILAFLFTILCAISLILNQFVDWSEILKLDHSLYKTLQDTFNLLIIFFCLNFVFQTITTLLIADQRPAKASIIQTIGQTCSLIAIVILAKTTTGSLPKLVFAFSGLPCMTLLLSSIFVFKSERYNKYKPSIKCVNISLTKNILGMGLKYFFTTCALFIVLQLINIIISRELGPTAVTQYNVTYKYYNVLLMAFMIIITPFWSAFTDAYTKNDYTWMTNIMKKLEYIFVAFLCLSAIMILVSPLLFKLWIGNNVYIPLSLSIFTCLLVDTQIFSSIYIYPINGTGKMAIQIIVDGVFALIAIPVIIYSCRFYGLNGILFFLIIFHTVLAIFCRKQLKLILNKKAKWIWNK